MVRPLQSARFKVNDTATLFGESPSAELREIPKTVAQAEAVLLDLADYVYAHTTLKPLSKTLFFLSRCLLLAYKDRLINNLNDLREAYTATRASLGAAAPEDDFDFGTVTGECATHLTYIVRSINRVRELTAGTDSLGLVFNTLLRGKFESGEGMGTFLTPEEVVYPMVEMLLATVAPDLFAHLSPREEEFFFGDICGGTGRFVYALTRCLEARGMDRRTLSLAARLFDQSRLAVDLGKLNFIFDGMVPTFQQVSDSLTSEPVSRLRGRFLLMATNPPFGTGKYRWNEELPKNFHPTLLKQIGITAPDGSADPSELFLFRNLDLLATGGAMGIVLPDGVLQATHFVERLRTYEKISRGFLDVTAVVSLPVATFALGGTVAKTSFLIIRKETSASERPLFVAAANHVGFLKRGNRRAEDPQGNDLETIAQIFKNGKRIEQNFVPNWRTHVCLAPSRLLHQPVVPTEIRSQTILKELVRAIREYTLVGTEMKNFHVSVLDVDKTGLIDIIAAAHNRPVSKGLRCAPGDILVSCLNPKIWRVAIVPRIDGDWSCSSEFLVLRAKKNECAGAIAIALHHESVVNAVRALSGGTSSSRQRVQKERVLDIRVPLDALKFEGLQTHEEARKQFYLNRLREYAAYERIHRGSHVFNF